eukprot:scaffold176089_cov28-Tisochrysis_lutea.AAC.5
MERHRLVEPPIVVLESDCTRGAPRARLEQLLYGAHRAAIALTYFAVPFHTVSSLTEKKERLWAAEIKPSAGGAVAHTDGTRVALKYLLEQRRLQPVSLEHPRDVTLLRPGRARRLQASLTRRAARHERKPAVDARGVGVDPSHTLKLSNGRWWRARVVQVDRRPAPPSQHDGCEKARRPAAHHCSTASRSTHIKERGGGTRRRSPGAPVRPRRATERRPYRRGVGQRDPRAAARREAWGARGGPAGSSVRPRGATNTGPALGSEERRGRAGGCGE